jgi:fused signal recognition particle receptor
VPVKYIGVGETIDDLQKFNADEFVDALFDIKREDADTEVEDAGDSLASEVETAMTDETATVGETDVESSGTDVEDMSTAEMQSAESSENVLPNEAPEIKFSWGDEEEEQTEEQPKKKKWGFWK